METTIRYQIKENDYEASGILRVLIYARLSRNRNGLSTNTSIQVHECVNEAQYYARQRSLKLIVVAIFEENDVSASKYSKKPRPDYLSVLELVKTNQVDVIFSTEMERLCRRPRELDDLIDLAEVTDLREIYLTSDEGYDLSTPNGIFRARQAVNHAERESRKISERIKRKLDQRAREGVSHGGRRPYGYKTGGMRLEEMEAERLREMGRCLLAGHSCREITYWANEQGWPTAEGKLWEPVSVNAMLRRPRYVGVRVHHGIEYPAKWPAVFDPQTWDRIQLTLRTTADKCANRSNGRVYLLTGLVHCGKCGTRMNGSSKQEPGRERRHIYMCRTEGTKQRRHGCGGVCRSAETLDYWITEAVLSRLDNPDLERLLDDDDSNDVALRDLLDQRDAQQLRLNSLVDDHSTGLLTRPEFARAKETAQRVLDRKEAEIVTLNRRRTSAGRVPVGQSLRTAWESNESHEW